MKLRVEQRRPMDEYIGEQTKEIKGFFRTYGFDEMWNVVSDTGEIIGGASTKERALDVLDRISLGGGNHAI